MKEDIIAANLSSLRADIQALSQKITEELNQNATEQSDSSLQIDETKVASLISDAVSTALQSRLYDDEKYVDKIVGSFTELANMYNIVTANCNKNAETLNRNIQLTEKRYAAMMKLMQEKKSKAIEQPPIPQTMKALPRFIFMTYPWYSHCKLMRLRWQALYPMLSVLPCSLAFMMMRSMWIRLLVPLRNLPICITSSQLTAIKMQRLLIAISN